MRFFTNKEISKKIIIAILLVMSFNFISPTLSMAGVSEAGGALFKPIGQLLVAVGDVVIILLQQVFLGNGIINYTVADGVTTYNIQYSPGAIFSNKIPGLDVNFMNPQEDYKVKIPEHWEKITGLIPVSIPVGRNDNFETLVENKFLSVLSANYGFSHEIAYKNSYAKDEHDIFGIYYDNEIEYNRYTWIVTDPVTKVETEYMAVVTVGDSTKSKILSTELGFLSGSIAFKALGELFPQERADEIAVSIYALLTGNALSQASAVLEWLKEEDVLDTMKFYLYSRTPLVERGKTIESTASILQSTISTWYKALRAISLVGLLSVLVYVGIRILISSTGESKAKYKKMIADWVAAICILFVLQYIMAAVLTVTEKIIEIFVPYAVDPSGRDALMSDIREGIFAGENGDFFNIFAYVLMYITLVIFTVMFTWQYIKRVIYMAFLTLIAPLISLTYPLDKIKDGQAQAFTMWIREYIFNALIQVVHLLVYCIFIGTGKDLLVRNNPLFAIAALGFLIPAEKFIKKMFGFDKANAGNVIGAAASGAVVMNAINKMGAKSGKQASGGKGDSGGSGNSGNSGKSTPRYIQSPGKNQAGSTQGANAQETRTQGGNGQETRTQGGNGQETRSQGTNAQAGRTQGGNGQAGSTVSSGSGSSTTAFGETLNPAQYGQKSRINGVKTLAGHYFNRGNLRKFGKRAGRTVRRGIIGAAGAAALGTVGLAAGLTTGEADKALQFGLAGGTAGYMGANYLGDTVTNKAAEFGNLSRDLYREGKWGTDEFNARNSIRELANDNDFNRVCKDMNITGRDREDLIRQFHSNGITKSEDIKKAMIAGLSTNNNDRSQIIAAAKIRKQATQYGMKKKDIENSLIGKGVTGAELTKAMNLIDML